MAVNSILWFSCCNADDFSIYMNLRCGMELQRKSISIDNIRLDPENFRLEATDSEDEAFENMLANQKVNLVNLAEDIIEHGLSPAEQLMVIADPDVSGKYIVCEGNRRVTALKFLNNPNLIQDEVYHTKFLNLSQKYKEKVLESVECVVFPSKEVAMVWIERKHQRLSGRGLTQWDAEANARRDESIAKIYRPSKIVIEYLARNNLLTDSLKQAIKRRTTNLDRIFQMPYMNDRLKIAINKRDGTIKFIGISDSVGNSILQRIVEKLAEREFPVKNILEKVQRIDFLEGFGYLLDIDSEPLVDNLDGLSSNASNSVGAKPSSSTSQILAGNEVNSEVRYPTSSSGTNINFNGAQTTGDKKLGYAQNKDTLNRRTLALTQQQYSFSVKDPRLTRLYREARRIDPSEFPNSASLLLRVFLELSVDNFLIVHNVQLPQKHIDNKKKNWTDIGINLREKIMTVLGILDPDKKNHSLKMAWKGASGDMSHSIESLHDMIHNMHGEQNEKELKLAWERWQPFFKIMYENP